jgi:predicted chitinase
MITQNQFTKIVSSTSRGVAIYPYFVAACKEFEINTSKRVAMFLAQLLHETARFRYMEEIASGAAYEPSVNPKLASRLGNTKEGDGKRYKGRGAIQLTGRSNYRQAGKFLGVDLEANPELAATTPYAFRIAGWYWKTRNLNELADVGDFREVTKKINGGYNGLDDRIRHWQQCKEALNVSP